MYGDRSLARCNHGTVRMFTRNGNDWMSKMPSLFRELAAFPARTESTAAWADTFEADTCGTALVVAATRNGRPGTFGAPDNAKSARYSRLARGTDAAATE